MKSTIFFFILFFISSYLIAQINLIHNNGLENCNGFPSDEWAFNKDGLTSTKIPNWRNPNKGYKTPPYNGSQGEVTKAHTYSCDYAIKLGYYSKNSPVFKPSDYRSYAVVNLLTSLKAGHVYRLSFYMDISFDDAQHYFHYDKVGVYFSDNQPKINHVKMHSRLSEFGSYQSFMLNSMTFVHNQNGWQKYTYDFYAHFNSQFLTIGSFAYYPSENIAFLYFDDLSLIDLGPYEDLCPPNRLFQNVSHLTNKVYYVQDYIRSGYNVGASGSPGLVYVNTSLPVVYQAGNYIDLEPGFDMHPGSNFMAHIAPCSANPCNESVAAPPDKTIEDCGNNAFQISTDFSFTPGATIKWSPSTHLSSNSGPSVFINPPSGSGQITYTVTYTNACMKSAQQKVIVKYSNNPSAAAPVVGNVINDEYQLYFEASSIASSEWISVNITDAVSGNHVDSTGRLLASSDYDPMFPFEYSAPLFNATSVCGNYHIELNVKNVCNSHISSDVIEWNRSAFCNPKPQILNIPTSFSPNGDGVDDQFCIEVCGVDEYEVEVKDRNGNIIYADIGIFTDNTVCVWDGAMINGQYAPPNLYTLKLTLIHCGNAIVLNPITINLIP